jgi:alpha-D-ribose 1-methylphosphonate 5-triphosphate synthase subunit PhnG
MDAVIKPLQERQAQMRLERSRKAATTKVEFFTLVRGDG